MIALVLAYICLGESQTSKSIRIPPTLLESTEYNDTSCLSTIGLEWRKTEILKIKNNTITSGPCACGGPGWTRVLYLNMTDQAAVHRIGNSTGVH